MSNIYSLEPRTRGRVILQTTHGPVELFLYSDESPIATRNFVQHALNGYYDGLPFHRVLPGELVQTGDPSGTGSGGVPAIGHSLGYPREQHGRLKFRRRGIAAMVADEEGKARSQFFLTLAATPWLDGQHTIFGQVQGDSIFNLLNLGSNKVEGFDGDNVPRVERVEVPENPFPDLKAMPKNPLERETPKKQRLDVPTAKKAVKSNTLLSFQDELDSESDDDAQVLAKTSVRRRQTSLRARTPGIYKGASGQAKIQKNQGILRDQVEKDEDETSKAPSRLDNSSILREAEKEFERIKAQLETESKPEVPAEEEKEVGERILNSKKISGKIDEINVTGRKRKGRQDESDVFQHLKEFEKRLTKSRRSQNGNTAAGPTNDMEAWFSRRLRLATSAMHQEEYEVRYGPPPRNKKQGGHR